MAKNKIKAVKKSAAATSIPVKTPRTLQDVRNDQNLWYKICVLVYDASVKPHKGVSADRPADFCQLRNFKHDRACENRTLQTTDPLYISAPYFTPEEAAAIKNALNEDGVALEQTISTTLENFFEKRRASGDYRPCGPHDIVPVYMSCFGLDKAEIEDERFMSRLRRSGLGK